MGGQGEGGFVRVDVLRRAAAEPVVAWEAVVPLVVFEGVDGKECGKGEEEAGSE